MTWGWPQWVFAFSIAFGAVVHISNHGKPRDKYSGPGQFIVALVDAWILWCGGFFG